MEFLKQTGVIIDKLRPNRYYLAEYVINDGKKHPFALILPGGAYSFVCTSGEGYPFAKKLNSMGYNAFVLFYRCGRRFPYPVSLEDTTAGLRYVLDRADDLMLDTDGWSLWGSSAGGHLAASFCTESMGHDLFGLPGPAALILSYPVITMGEKTHAQSRRNLIGADPSPEMVRLTSIEYQVTENFPPTFVWCHNADCSVPHENSLMLASALKEKDVEYVLTEYPGTLHGAGIGKGDVCEGWFEKAVEFWEKQRNKE